MSKYMHFNIDINMIVHEESFKRYNNIFAIMFWRCEYIDFCTINLNLFNYTM